MSQSTLPTTPLANTARPAAARRASLGLAAIALLAGATTLGVAAPALAHDELLSTEVVADANTGAVEAFELKFSNSIIEVGTEIVVTSADGADITDGTPEVSGPDVVQPLAADLPEGDYDVAWRVVSSDGHPIDGAFVLRLTEPSAWQAEEAVIVEPDARIDEGAEGGSAEGADGADHNSADHDHGTGSASDEPGGLSTGAIAAISIGAVLVAGGALAAVLIGQRRRAEGMRADAASDQEDRA